QTFLPALPYTYPMDPTPRCIPAFAPGVFPDPLPALSAARRGLLWFECLALFFVLPPALYFWRQALAFRVVPLVLAAAGFCAWWLVRQPGCGWAGLWRATGQARHLRGVALWFLAGALPLAIITYIWLPERFLSFPRQRPGLWTLVCVLYPLLAAWPQEIIFRAFFCRRYAALFPQPVALIAASAISFGLAHALYGNWVAPLMSAVGGALFAWRYLRSGSLLVAGVEHGLWGDFLFTSGLGWFFYSGAIS
ncbi:MAG: CPBP family intramembrane glutamic endopeptidase, partial [Pseudomonadota bacterium]